MKKRQPLGAWWQQIQTVWRVTGIWGTLWLVWLGVTVTVQGVLLLLYPDAVEIRRNVNTVLAIGMFGLMYIVFEKIQKGKEAHSPTVNKEETPTTKK